MNFDWSELAFGNKSEVKRLKAVFIAAPRDISEARFKQLVKQYLPNGNIVLGVSKEKYVIGLEDQPQFKMLEQKSVQKTIELVNKSSKSNKIYTIAYFQKDLPYLIEKLNFSLAVFVNGSWYRMFHTQPFFYALVTKNIPYQLVAAYCDEAEALNQEKKLLKQIVGKRLAAKNIYSETDLIKLVEHAAKESFDYAAFQTGLVLAKPLSSKSKYQLLAAVHNKVVPYETYAMLVGSARESNFSPVNDLNFYDTVHAEVEMLLYAQQKKIDLKNTVIFTNLMPCPTCARMLSQSDVAELVYMEDHSDGYAIKLLEKTGKKVRRVVVGAL